MSSNSYYPDGMTPQDFPLADSLLGTGADNFPGNIDPVTGFPTITSVSSNPVGPVLANNNPVSISIANSFMAGWTYRGVPYTGDSSKSINPIGMPTWLTRGSLHRAKWVIAGPYSDPNGFFTVPLDYALVYWEIKQGTQQYTPPADEMIPSIFAILPIDRSFIDPVNLNTNVSKPLMFQYVNPDLTLVKHDDDVAVWFSFTRPAHIIGVFRSPDEIGFGRNNRGQIGHR